MHVEQRGNTMEVDLHGLTVEDAKSRLEHLLSGAPANVAEVRVIHGCHRGQALRDMVRLRLKHPRIAVKLLTLNPGETRLLLKPPGAEKQARKPSGQKGKSVLK
ncbi:MAG: Smr/MutS family protein [Oscillospiraceae bacterium]|nr:Smr/MutS family protein [Oscillospiraceae bacterium]MCI1990305.1 Smr/MutS family protein [Oscillospiraceae bacterium]MCI2034584.1 Smr/MutS family protein [Oscillospiraceae bacterium]